VLVAHRVQAFVFCRYFHSGNSGDVILSIISNAIFRNNKPHTKEFNKILKIAKSGLIQEAE